MFTEKEWGTVLRFWSDGLPSAYANSLAVESVDRRTRLANVGGAGIVHGAGIVMVVSLLERLVLDCLSATPAGPPKVVKLNDPSWRLQLGLNPVWDGTVALDGLVALRHCFAHEYGRVTARQKPIVTTFLAELQANKVSVTARGKSHPLPAFFDIEAGDTLRLDAAGTSAALRHVASGVLEHLVSAGHVVL